MSAMTNPPSAPSSPTEAAATRLGRALAQKAAAHPGLSAIHALPVSGDAFAARVALAERSAIEVERPPTGGERSLTTEPRTSAAKRALVRFLSVLPIEWMP